MNYDRKMNSLHALRAVISLSLWTLVSSVGGYMDQQTTYNTQGQVQKVFRERHVDHWDSDTLAYYLDEYPGFDAAVMFYAQWDGNSRALAPYWAKIAAEMDAGTSEGRLVMALFDCELNVAHSELCHAVGITHYPTMMFIGSGPYHDTDPFSRAIFGKAAAGIFGESPVINTVKFQGNWQYTESIADWIRTMQALSNWHLWNTEGLGRRLRNFFLPSRKKKVEELPVGVPGRSSVPRSGATGSATMGASASSDSTDSLQMQAMEAQLEQLTSVAQQYEKMVDRSANLLDSVLLGGSGSKDMFTMLKEQNAWKKSSRALPEVLRTCVAELSIDYCQRISQKVANDLVDDLTAQGMTVDEMLALPDLEQRILDLTGQEEPYCLMLDNCVISDFEAEGCQPEECPFKNPAACQYMTSCLNPALQQEYADALGISLETNTTPAEESSQGDTQKKKWGF